MKKYIPFVNRNQSKRISVDEIIYIVRKDRKIRVVTKREDYIMSGKLEDIDKYLDKRFYYCLKNFIINFEQVDKMEEQTIYFRNGEKITIGRGNYIKSRQTFSAYIRGLF